MIDFLFSNASLAALLDAEAKALVACSAIFSAKSSFNNFSHIRFRAA
jgi:tRNA A37 threonylcarbamoyladenosine synthetase subunit TsaC/SUA5/YrdC